MTFRLNQTVQWDSQSQGYLKTKKGHVEAIVPAGQSPNRVQFPSLYLGAGPGGPRKHESYVVLVKRPSGSHDTYWPRVSALRPIT